MSRRAVRGGERVIYLIDDCVEEAWGTLPPLERACFLATWCLVGRLKREARCWLKFAEYVAEPTRGEVRTPRVKG